MIDINTHFSIEDRQKLFAAVAAVMFAAMTNESQGPEEPENIQIPSYAMEIILDSLNKFISILNLVHTESTAEKNDAFKAFKSGFESGINSSEGLLMSAWLEYQRKLKDTNS